MVEEHQLVSIFCEIDDFCKEFDKNIQQALLMAHQKVLVVQPAVCQ